MDCRGRFLRAWRLRCRAPHRSSHVSREWHGLCVMDPHTHTSGKHASLPMLQSGWMMPWPHSGQRSSQSGSVVGWAVWSGRCAGGCIDGGAWRWGVRAGAGLSLCCDWACAARMAVVVDWRGMARSAGRLPCGTRAAVRSSGGVNWFVSPSSSVVREWAMPLAVPSCVGGSIPIAHGGRKIVREAHG